MLSVNNDIKLRKHEARLDKHEARLDKHDKKINSAKERQSKIIQIINNHEEKLLATMTEEETSIFDRIQSYLCCR